MSTSSMDPNVCVKPSGSNSACWMYRNLSSPRTRSVTLPSNKKLVLEYSYSSVAGSGFIQATTIGHGTKYKEVTGFHAFGVRRILERG